MKNKRKRVVKKPIGELIYSTKTAAETEAKTAKNVNNYVDKHSYTNVQQ